MSTVEKKLEDLFQEGLCLFSMDSKPSRGIAWVDNMYQKFEVMCKGVDDNKFLQETSKFVEDQVQSVGLNVRKFCAEFVHELLTSPSDSQVKVPLTDLSLTYGEVIENHGKVKEGLEKFCPLDKELPEPKELQAGSDFGKDLQDDSFSLDENQDNFSSGGACDEAKNDAPSQPQVRCGYNSEGGNYPGQPVDSDRCSNLVQDPLLLPSSPPSDRLLEKGALENVSNAVVASSSVKAATWTSPIVEHMMDVASDNTKLQQSVLPQDIQLSAESEFTVVPASICSDEATECNQKIRTRKFLSFRASQNGKRLAERSAKVVHTASSSTDKTCLHKSAEDDDYEQVAYWYVNIDSESKQKKGISPINLVNDTRMGRSVNVDNCESDWEFL